MEEDRSGYSDRVILIRFAVFGSEGGPVPDGALITSATLSLYKTHAYSMEYGLHSVLQPWEESAATWNERLDGIAWEQPRARGLGSDISVEAVAHGLIGWDPG